MAVTALVFTFNICSTTRAKFLIRLKLVLTFFVLEFPMLVNLCENIELWVQNVILVKCNCLRHGNCERPVLNY